VSTGTTTKKLGGVSQRLTLGTLPQVRHVYARVCRDFWRGDIDEAKARTMVYCLTGLLAAFNAQKSDDIERRITALEGKEFK